MNKLKIPKNPISPYDYKNKILTLRQQAEIKNKWLKKRLETILPKLMQREEISMWIIIAREYNEDPVIMSLLPEPMMSARRRTILVLTKQEDNTIERLIIKRGGLEGFYTSTWNPDEQEQYDHLAQIIKERKPKNIGINISETFAFGDGLTHSEFLQLEKALGSELMNKTKSAEKLCIGWLETRLPEEIEAYHGLVEITHALVSEAFSSRVITPSVTTTDDVVWWMRQTMHNLGLQAWFQPSIGIQAPDVTPENRRKQIRQGDVLHCDVGFYYLGLATDIQQMAYVLKLGENDAPEYLKEALEEGNRLQNHHAEAMKEGLTGNQILLRALDQAKKDGLAPSIYTHPVGVHGHAAGPIIGLWDRQEGVPGRGDYPLYNDTCYAIELNIKKQLPHWNKEIRIALEQDAVFTNNQLHFMAGRQRNYHLVG